MFLLIEPDGGIAIASDQNLWAGRDLDREIASGYTVVEFAGAFPDWPRLGRPGEPQWYRWDGSAPVPRSGFDPLEVRRESRVGDLSADVRLAFRVLIEDRPATWDEFRVALKARM